MASAADEEECGSGAGLIRSHEGEPMRPNGLLDLCGAAPRLTGERNDKRRRARLLVLPNELPGVTGIRLRQISVECGFSGIQGNGPVRDRRKKEQPCSGNTSS